MSQRAAFRDGVLVVAAAMLVLLLFLGRAPLQIWDESVYCDATVNMHRFSALLYAVDGQGEFLHWYGKPPFVNWLQLLSTWLLGWNQFALRLPVAIGGVCLVALIWLTGMLLSGRTVGLVAASLALSSPHFVSFTRHVWLESLLAVVFAAAFLLHAHGRDRADRRAVWWRVAAGAVLGLGILVKQAFGGFGLVAVAGAEWGVARQGAIRRLWPLFLAAVAVSGWWLLGVFATVGLPAFDSLVDFALFKRLTQSIDGHGRSPDDYARALDHWVGGLSWALGLLGWWALARRKDTDPMQKRIVWGWSLMLILHFLVVGLAMRTVTPWYQFVVVLPIFVGTAFLLVDTWNKNEANSSKWILILLFVVLLATRFHLNQVLVVGLTLAWAVAFETRAARWVRKWARGWQVLLLAVVVALAQGRPWAQSDPWLDLVAQVPDQPSTLAVAHRARWQLWRCYLPAATVRPWPRNCGTVRDEFQKAEHLILVGPARKCVTPDFELLTQQGEVQLFRRVSSPPASSSPE